MSEGSGKSKTIGESNDDILSKKWISFETKKLCIQYSFEMNLRRRNNLPEIAIISPFPFITASLYIKGLITDPSSLIERSSPSEERYAVKLSCPKSVADISSISTGSPNTLIPPCCRPDKV